MISAHYPAGMSECDRRGLNGNCGPPCSILEDGECPVEEEFISNWVAVCRDSTGRPELKVGKEYPLERKPSDFVTINGEEFLVGRFDVEPVMKEEFNEA